MRRRHNPNKVPPLKPNPEHWTRKVHSWKAKVAYETEDDACGNIIPIVYTCKDCFFFDNGVWECKEERFGRDVSEDDDACTDFEYKEIKVEL